MISGNDKVNNLKTENTSGQGNASVVPPEVQRWNGGAFFLTWIWAIGNRLWIWALIGIIASALSLIPSDNTVALGAAYTYQIVVSIVLGLKGNKWAWQSKKWNSVEQFQRTQRKWLNWGMGLTLLGIAILLYLTYSGG